MKTLSTGMDANGYNIADTDATVSTLMQAYSGKIIYDVHFCVNVLVMDDS